MTSLKEKLPPSHAAILSYIGFLTVGLGFALLIPLVVLFFPSHDSTHIFSFLIPSAIAFIFGVLLRKLFRLPKPPFLTTPDAAFIVTAVWVIAVLLGAYPFVLGHILSPIDAIFEAMSGWTTTGLTMVNPDEVPNIFLFWRSLMQFIGGAGLVVMMLTAIIGSLGPGVYKAEARTDQLVPNVMHTARLIVKIYLAYYFLGVLLYRLCGMQLFDALCHAMSGLATGGFSTHSASIGWWQSFPIELVSMFLMLLGTINFATHHAILSSRGRKGYLDDELRLMGIIILIMVPLVGCSLLLVSEGPLSSMRQGAFQVISALSGTGYVTANLTIWAELPLFILVMMMLVEGGTGSTAGGIKQYRVCIIIKSIWWWIKKQFYPQSAVIQRTIWRRGERFEIQDNHVQAVASFVGLYLLTYLAGVFVLLVDGFSLKESFFEFASALGTVGLSLGVTSPSMPLASKIAEIIGMWLGRLEFIAIFHALIHLKHDLMGG